jgi:hypothetical protein
VSYCLENSNCSSASHLGSARSAYRPRQTGPGNLYGNVRNFASGAAEIGNGPFEVRDPGVGGSAIAYFRRSPGGYWGRRLGGGCRYALMVWAVGEHAFEFRGPVIGQRFRRSFFIVFEKGLLYLDFERYFF